MLNCVTTQPETLLGIEIGGTKLQLVVSDSTNHHRETIRLSVESANGATGIREQIKTAVAKIVAQQTLSAIGVGFGGPVHWRTGKICRSHQIEGWSEFNLRGWLEPLAGAPVFVDNDANVAALGEATFGAGKDHSPVFYVTLGSGVGGGLVIDGAIYHGATPGEAEVGHLRLDREGTTVESRCSGWAVDAKIRALQTRDPASLLAQLSREVSRGEAVFLPEAIKQNDPAALRILHETADDLAFGLSHVTQLFHPEIIVIGGGLSNIGEPLRAAVESALKKYVMEAFAPGLKIQISQLNENAVPFGALELAHRGLAAS